MFESLSSVLDTGLSLQACSVAMVTSFEQEGYNYPIPFSEEDAFSSVFHGMLILGLLIQTLNGFPLIFLFGRTLGFSHTAGHSLEVYL